MIEHGRPPGKNGIQFLALFTLCTILIAAPLAAQRAKKPVVKGKTGKLLDRYLTALDLDIGGMCGSAFVAEGKKVYLDKGYGMADVSKKRKMPVNALWDWASVTKQFTAAAILKLEMQGKLSLDDSIRKFYRNAPGRMQPITLRHMLNHTSGIDQSKRPTGVDFRKRKAMLDWFLKRPVAAKPGTKWEYSNLAYFVLAALIEKKSGLSCEQFCIKHLFRPAGMKDACFIGSPGLDLDRVPREERGKGKHFAYGYDLSWGYRGSGGAIATPREMWLWDRALRGTKILDRAAKAKLYEVGLKNYALGWYVKPGHGDTCWEHSGAVGKTVTYYLRTKRSRIVVALAYSYRPDQHPKITADEMVNIVRKGQPSRWPGGGR